VNKVEPAGIEGLEKALDAGASADRDPLAADANRTAAMRRSLRGEGKLEEEDKGKVRLAQKTGIVNGGR
jgi:hypothetical protein